MPTANTSAEPPVAPDAGLATQPASVERRTKESLPCGQSSCDYKTEVCCESENGGQMTGCVKKTLAPKDNGKKCYGPQARGWIVIECLTSADCPSAEQCCSEPVEEIRSNHCAARCDTPVTCIPDQAGGCRAGFRCKPDVSSRSGGLCVVEAPRTACGTKTCSGATPACCYDMKTKRGKCMALSPDTVPELEPACPMSENTALLQCTTPKDCGGEDCCIGGPVTTSSCGGDQCRAGIQTCGSVADCPEFMGPPTGCRADPELPFLKICRYQGK